MKEFFKKNWKILLIIGVASLLRLWNLASVPPSLTSDEAALGYNAYSILKTGRDEYGQLLPVVFKSFGDFKTGAYVYLAAPFVALFGLNEFSVRLPGALAGILGVYLIYLICRRLFDKERVALTSAFVFAITPWAIFFSRGAWEANVSLTLTLAGIYFFLKAVEKPKYLLSSAAFFALTLSTYQGAKLATLLVVLILAFLYRRQLFSINKKYLVGSVILGALIAIPIVLSTFQGQTGRLNVFSLFSYPRSTQSLSSFLDQGREKVGDAGYYLFHSEGLNFKRAILGRWFNHFSARFLFFEGDWPNPRHSAPNHGMLLLSDLVLLIIGFVALVRLGAKKETAFIWLWLILAPLPAAMSRDQVHAVRGLNLVAPLTMVLSLGLERVLSARKVFRYLFGVAFVLSFIYFLDAYFVHLPEHNSKYWGYGYKQIVETITPIQEKYKQIKVQQSFSQPYIYFLFYQKYDPDKYQKQAKLVESEYKGDVGYVERLDNICFCAIDWPAQRGEAGTLFITDEIAIPSQDTDDESQFKLVKEIKYLNGLETAFRIVEVK
jgi:4-amino-4-deoxy-L-arabinose transferase-like glycosyltransferase